MAVVTPYKPSQVIAKCRELVEDFDHTNFLDVAKQVRDYITAIPPSKRVERKWIHPFLLGLKPLEAEYSAYVERDPAILYQPAHEVALAFHKSPAKIRYNRSANRTSKTQTGFLEHYFVATGQHPYRKVATLPTATAIIGVDFSKYAPNVFEKKFITGEPGNILSPLFPIGGKWLHKYDDRKHIIYIACPKCAEAGEADKCPHQKSTISLFSDISGPAVLQGAQYNLVHFDEHVSEEFFEEAMERTKTVEHGSIIITGTPLMSRNSWEHRRITTVWLQGPKANKIYGTDIPLVSLHTIGQLEAGLVPVEEIENSKKLYDPLEQEARIHGRPAPLARHSVFDRYALHEMEQHTVEPQLGMLESQEPMSGPITFKPTADGDLRLWHEPVPGGQYIIGCDVAAGLTNRDFSCASVMRLPKLEVVAQLHGWINPGEYAKQVARIGRWYNMAIVVVERTGGLGVGMIYELKRLLYWRLFRDLADLSQTSFVPDALFGVDTNIRTKSQMIGVMQQVIADRQITIPCAATVEEFCAYGQEVTPSGLNTRFRGEYGSHDDRVMSIVLATYVAIVHPMLYLAELEQSARRKAAQDPETKEFWDGVNKEIENKQKSERDMYISG